MYLGSVITNPPINGGDYDTIQISVAGLSVDTQHNGNDCKRNYNDFSNFNIYATPPRPPPGSMEIYLFLVTSYYILTNIRFI